MKYTNVLKGLAIGVANIIPGVSGGTLAVLLGIYEKLTEAIGNFFFVEGAKRREYFFFLLQIAIGAALGILLFAKGIRYSVKHYPKSTAIFFMACILPSIYFIVKPYPKKKQNIIMFCLGALFLFAFICLSSFFSKEGGEKVITGLPVFSLAYAGKLILCGLLAAGAMLIPGISGSLLLLILGEYYNILSFISQFQILPLFALALGVGLGMLLFSKIIHFLLKRYEEKMMFFMAGIVLMSVVQIWQNLA